MTAIASKSVGIWIRVSTEDQARGDSPEHHEKRAKHYAAGNGAQAMPQPAPGERPTASMNGLANHFRELTGC